MSSSGSAATACSAPTSTPTRKSDRYLFHLLQGGLGLPDESYYRDDKFAEIRDTYVDYLERLFELGGHDDPAAAAATVLEIDTRLAAGHWERAETRDVQKTYNLLTAGELEELCPAFDWDAYVRNLGGTEETIAEVCVRQPSYLSHLSEVLDETPIEDWRTWMLSRVLRSAAPYLTDDFVETNFDFYGRTLNGTPELRARWKRAVGFVEGAIGEAVGEDTSPGTSRPQQGADGRAGRQPARGLPRVHHRPRLDDRGDQAAGVREARHVPAQDRLPRGVPRLLRTGRPQDDLMGNAAAAPAFETDRQLAKIGSPVDRDEWFMLPQTVNAYYNPGTNEICFPAGILQKPFFSPDADAAENYGGIGAVIGHEIGHGFDDQGAQYDGAGNLNDWWTPTTRPPSR